jgi:3-hydroxyisobutyrate dehydrogenase
MSLRVIALSKNINNLIKYNHVFNRSLSSNGDGKHIGFIGLGNMGGPMASNLMKKGHKLHVYDVSPQAVNALKSNGAKAYTNTRELAKNSEFVITMLPNGDIVTDCFKEMVDGSAPKDTIFIDSSTIGPTVAQSVQKLVSERGYHFVDAPVSGGVPGAVNATLTFMVGSTGDEFEKIKDVLQGMGGKITHCGGYGMGQAAKLCNNMMLGISMIGLAECMNLAMRLGLDAKTFADIVNSSTGRCWSSEVYSPVPDLTPNSPSNKNYDGGFSTGLITKDLGLASNVAVTSNTPIPMGSLAHQIYRTLCAKGLANKDFSVVYDFMKNDRN